MNNISTTPETPKYWIFFSIPVEIQKWNFQIKDFMGDEKNKDAIISMLKKEQGYDKIVFSFTIHPTFSAFDSIFKIWGYNLGWNHPSVFSEISEKKYYEVINWKSPYCNEEMQYDLDDFFGFKKNRAKKDNLITN